MWTNRCRCWTNRSWNPEKQSLSIFLFKCCHLFINPPLPQLVPAVTLVSRGKGWPLDKKIVASGERALVIPLYPFLRLLSPVLISHIYIPTNTFFCLFKKKAIIVIPLYFLSLITFLNLNPQRISDSGMSRQRTK